MSKKFKIRLSNVKKVYIVSNIKSYFFQIFLKFFGFKIFQKFLNISLKYPFYVYIIYMY